MNDIFGEKTPIYKWQQFVNIVRHNGYKLLGCLNKFSNPVLVTGCQRSGTTLLSRIFTESEGMTNYWFGKDSELDAALILSGYVDHEPVGRYCFQTTYMYDQQSQYLENKENQKIIWVMRNPHSVVYSMRYNWQRFALNEVFYGCGISQLSGEDRARYKRYGGWSVSRLRKACYSYNGKMAELDFLRQNLEDDQLRVIVYDDLIKNKDTLLPKLYDFIGLGYEPVYAEKINSSSIGKRDKLKVKESRLVTGLCMKNFERALKYV